MLRLPKKSKINKTRVATLFILSTLILGIVADFVMQPLSVYGATVGDGVTFYGQSADTTPKFRNYVGSSDTFGAETNTVANATPDATAIETSPRKIEAIAAYKNTTNTMQVMCFDGTTWTNEWTATVTNIADRRPFDIAYETSSGDVVVTYGTGNTASNEVAFRTKAHASGCGSANWAAATNVTLARTSAAIDWVRTVSDPNSDTLGAAFSDGTRDATAMIWSGSGWANEPSAALTTNIDYCCTSTIDDVEAIDLTFESVSSDLMVVWSEDNAGASNTDYKMCTGGGGSCSWGTTTDITGFSNYNTSLDLSSNPTTDEIVMAGQLGILSLGYWNGSGWTESDGVDGSGDNVIAGGKTVATTWLKNGNTVRSLIVYADQDSSNVDFYTGNGSTFTKQTDFNYAPSPGFGVNLLYYRLEADPLNPDRAMLTFNDSSSDFFGKRVTMDAAGVMTWANSDGSAALEASLSGTVAGAFDYAYWRAPPTFDQATYRWYANADAVQPGSALFNENTAGSITIKGTPLRLRAALTNSGNGLPASNRAFKLQFATSTSGPWSDVGDPEAWCNDNSGIGCNNDWLYRRKVTFNNSASGTNLTDFPVLIKLSAAAGNIDYSKTQNSGQDLRFVDANAPTVALDHEIEKWDESGISYVWVKVPQINSGSTTDSIWMYYGNPTVGNGEDVINTWHSSFKMVQHLEESATCATTFTDSTVNDNDGTCNDSPTYSAAGGRIDGARDFDGTNDFIPVAHDATLNVSDYTVEAWVYVNTTGEQSIVDKRGPNATSGYQIRVEGAAFPLSARVVVRDSVNGEGSATATSQVPQNTLTHIAGTFNNTTNDLTVYVNGQSVATANFAANPSVGANTDVLRIGEIQVAGFSVPSAFNFDGIIDDARVSNVVRSADWLEAQYLTGTDTMNTYGSEELQSSGTWKYYNNPTPADGATITTALLTGSPTLQSYTESKPTALNPNIIATGSKGEWDFSLDSSNICSGTYYFRMVESDGTVLAAYTAYPQMTVDVAGPIDLVMRHGGFWRNNAEQPYSCEWVGTTN